MKTIPYAVLQCARDWIGTCAYECRSDVSRLGLSAAARYNFNLMLDCDQKGDNRWELLTKNTSAALAIAAIKEALGE
jgi:hypothetical protein